MSAAPTPSLRFAQGQAPPLFWRVCGSWRATGDLSRSQALDHHKFVTAFWIEGELGPIHGYPDEVQAEAPEMPLFQGCANVGLWDRVWLEGVAPVPYENDKLLPFAAALDFHHARRHTGVRMLHDVRASLVHRHLDLVHLLLTKTHGAGRFTDAVEGVGDTAQNRSKSQFPAFSHFPQQDTRPPGLRDRHWRSYSQEPTKNGALSGLSWCLGADLGEQ